MSSISIYHIGQTIKDKKNNLFAKRFMPVLVLSFCGLSVAGLTSVFGAQPVDVSVNIYSQCSNDDGDGYAVDDTGCRWTNGNLQSNNSTYYEGDATVQRLLVEDITPGTDHTVTFKYGTTKGGKHAYDFLTTDKYSEDWISDADMCDGATSSKFPSCAITPASADTADSSIPQDPSVPDSYESFARHFRIRNGTITDVSTPTIVSGNYTGDSETAITVTFTVPNDCEDQYTVGNGQNQTDVCAALITFGAHISKGSDWGVGTTAVNISGSPYHVALDSIDGTSAGQRDNQMQASAIILPSTITINKVTDPNTDTTTSFAFTTTGADYDGFSLTGGTQNQQSVVPGTYSVTETNPGPAYALSNLTCNASGTGTSATPNTGTRTVAITIGATGGGSVNCTYTNTLQQAHLTLVKTVTNDNGGTAAATDWTLAASGPTPISGATATAAVTNAAVNSGQYNLSESGGPTGYTASTYSCVNNGGQPVVSNSITLAPGDNATCTINNDDDAPRLILNKVVINDDGGTAAEGAWTLSASGTTPLSGFGAAGDNDVVSGADFVAGTYALSESGGPAGYAASDWTCVGGSQTGSNISVALGETATCTITNNDIQPKLTLVKIVVNDNGGNAVVGDFPLFVDATGVTSGVQNGFDAGNYTASETSQAGYTAGSWTGDCAANGSVTLAPGDEKTCTITNDDQPAQIILNKVVVNDNGGTAGINDFGLSVGGATVNSGVTTNVNSNTAVVLNEAGLAGYSFVSLTGDAKCPNALGGSTAALNEGETITCTITNDDVAGSLTIVKNTTGGDGEFNFAVNGPTSSTPSITTTAGTGSVGPSSVDAGTYTVAETVPSGWTLTTGSCNDGTSSFAVDTVSNIQISLGENVTCTFANTKKGHIIVDKITNPSGDTQSFDFTAGGAGYNNFSLTDASAPNDQEVLPGAYTVSENALVGWDSDGGVCDNGETPASLDVGPGETITCTFTNTKRGHLIVQKTTIPSGDQTSFAITASGSGTIAGSANGSVTDATDYDYDVSPGTYSVAETVPTGWDKTGDTCQNVVVAAGQTATCLLTNTKRANLTIVKDAQPNDLIDFSFNGGTLGNFLLDDDAGVADAGVPPDVDRSQSQTFANIVSGNYTVSESLPNAFWAFDSVTCVLTGTSTAYANTTNINNGVTVALDPGVDVTCTFVNTKESPTRTQGFWQTHTAYTSAVFNNNPGMFVGVNIVPGLNTHKGQLTTTGQLFGAYFSNIAKKTDNKQRNATDKARMVLLQQLVTAKLNCATFGCASSIQSMISTADAAYAAGNASAMKTSTAALDAYNNSGDTITIGNAGKATPTESKTLADLDFWDQP